MNDQSATRAALTLTGDGRRADLIDAAARLMARRGFEGTSVADIGQEVGITAAGLYRHFSNKAALFETVILGMLSDLVATIEHPGAAAPTVTEVQALFVTFVLDHPHHVATYLREQRRLDDDAGAAQADLEAAFFAAQGHALGRATGTVVADDDPLMRLRIAASFGAARAHTRGSGSLNRPALDGFLARALVPVATTPLATPGSVSDETGQQPWHIDSPRRRILDNAVPLFREQGFGGVGVAEVGEAAGIAGPNVYRYFDSKIDLLVDAFDRVGQRVMVGLEDAVSGAADADDALTAIVNSYVAAAYDNVDLIVVMDQERTSLPESERPRLRRRAALFGETWRGVVAECRPDLSTGEVNTLVRAATSLVNTCCRQRPVATAENVAAIAEAFLRGTAEEER